MIEKEELYDSVEEEKSFLLSSFYKILIVLGVIIFAITVGEILFGTRSVEVLLKLDKEEKALKQEIKAQKKQNAKLQRQLFEYEYLTGSQDDK